jgi:MerR family transcriptional regulator, light-induced transcriptional regulator
MNEKLTLQEAAERLGVHYMTAYNYVRLGRLPAERRGRQWQVDRADLDVFVAAAGQDERRGRTGGGTQWARHRQRLLSRLLASDEPGSWAVIEAAIGAGANPRDVYLELLAPVLEEIGRKWKDGEIDVSDEHAATSVAGRIVGRLGPRFARRGQRRGTVVLAAVAGENHWLPLALLADILRGAGWRVIDLGGDTPDDSIIEAARAAGDDLVCVGLSVANEERLPLARRSAEAIKRAIPEVPVLVGGPAVKTAADAASVHADGWAPEAGATCDLLDRLRPLRS